MPYSVSLTTGNTLNPDPQLGNFGQPIEDKKGAPVGVQLLRRFRHINHLECARLSLSFDGNQTSSFPELTLKKATPCFRASSNTVSYASSALGQANAQ